MAKAKRERVERGLYRVSGAYWACVTPKGTSKAEWSKLGDVGLQEARRLRDEFAVRVHGTDARQAARRRITVTELVEEWLEALEELRVGEELRPRTITSYSDGVRLHFEPDFGARQLASISADDLVSWHERQRRTGAATWSIRARWMGIRSLFGYAARMGLIAGNPCELLTRRERPKPGKAKERYLDQHEIRCLIDNANGDSSDIVSLLLFSGLRAAEALGLVWGDVNFEAQSIHVRKQMSRQGQRVPIKTHAGARDVILMEQLAQALRKRRLAAHFSSETDLVFGNGVGRTLGYSRFLKAFTAAADAANLAETTPHTCRHTFASILIDGGASVEFVSDQLGHATTKTTWDIYVHLFRRREHAETARRQLDAAYGPMLRAVSRDGEPR